jgi:hypothetical protein
MCPRSPTTAYAPSGRSNSKTFVPAIRLRFILPSERTTAIRSAVLNFSATTKVRGGATDSRGRAS